MFFGTKQSCNIFQTDRRLNHDNLQGQMRQITTKSSCIDCLIFLYLNTDDVILR